MPTYPMTRKTASAIVAELGEEFGAAIANETLGSRVISERFGISRNRVQRVRRALHGNIRPRTKINIADPRTLEVLKRRITHAEVAKILDVHITSVIGWRNRLRIKSKFVRELRYTETTMALLRSSLSNRDVARALNIAESTVYEHRKAIKGVRPYRAHDDITDEQRAIIHEPISVAEVKRRTGLGVHRIYIERQQAKAPPLPEGWPQDRTWYEDKTPKEIAEAVGCSRSVAYFYVRTRGLNVRLTQCRGK